MSETVWLFEVGLEHYVIAVYATAEAAKEERHGSWYWKQDGLWMCDPKRSADGQLWCLREMRVR